MAGAAHAQCESVDSGFHGRGSLGVERCADCVCGGADMIERSQSLSLSMVIGALKK